MKVSFVNLGAQFLDLKEEIVKKFSEISERGAYILGDEVAEFEKRFAQYCGTKYAVAVANGTDALFLVLKALRVGPGDEVITAPNSFIASASCIALTGATPVFADVGADYNIDPKEIAKKITKRTKGIIPVHLTGMPADMDAINALAKKHNLFVLEDCAQAIGATYKGNKVGSLGIAGGFSLHPLKNLHVHGDGGAITTDDKALYEKLLLIRNHGLINRDVCEVWAYNSRLDAIQAAIGTIKLKHMDAYTRRFQEIANRYHAGLKGVIGVPEMPADRQGVFHNFVLKTDKRDALQKFLANKGVETKVHYPIAIHLQPAAKSLGHKKGDFPVTEKQCEQILSLPIYPELTDAEVQYVIDSIKQFFVTLDRSPSRNEVSASI